MACIYPDFLGFSARFWVVWGGKSLFKGTDVSAKKRSLDAKHLQGLFGCALSHCYLGSRLGSDQTLGESLEKISEITGTDSSVFTINNQPEYQDQQSHYQHHQV